MRQVEVLPDKDSPFAYALSSLNSSLTNKGGHAEFVSDFGDNNAFKYINGSYVKTSGWKILLTGRY